MMDSQVHLRISETEMKSPKLSIWVRWLPLAFGRFRNANKVALLGLMDSIDAKEAPLAHFSLDFLCATTKKSKKKQDLLVAQNSGWMLHWSVIHALFPKSLSFLLESQFFFHNCNNIQLDFLDVAVTPDCKVQLAGWANWTVQAIFWLEFESFEKWDSFHHQMDIHCKRMHWKIKIPKKQSWHACLPQKFSLAVDLFQSLDPKTSRSITAATCLWKKIVHRSNDQVNHCGHFNRWHSFLPNDTAFSDQQIC